MSEPVNGAEVPEVERLREQVRRLEERDAGLSALLQSYTGQVEMLRQDLDSEIMERAAMGRRADRDRLRFEALKQVAAEHYADTQRMRATVQQANAAVERLQAEARGLRVGAVVQMAKSSSGSSLWRGVVVHIDGASVLVWWKHPGCDLAKPHAPDWASRDGLTVVG